MNSLYLNIFSGISGDMFLGAMLDLGVEFSQLQAELAKLELTGYHLRMADRERVADINRQLTSLRQQQDRLLNLRLLNEINAETFASKSQEFRD